MKCDKCKFGIPKRDVFTGKIKYYCGEKVEILVPPNDDYELANSEIVIDCKAGEEIPIDENEYYLCPFCHSKFRRKHDFCVCGADMRGGTE